MLCGLTAVIAGRILIGRAGRDNAFVKLAGVPNNAQLVAAGTA
jgi:hypothetical protein